MNSSAEIRPTKVTRKSGASPPTYLALLLPSLSVLLVLLDPRLLRKKPLCVRAVSLPYQVPRPTRPSLRFLFRVFRVQGHHPMDYLGVCLPTTPSGSTRFLCKWAAQVWLVTPSLTNPSQRRDFRRVHDPSQYLRSCR